MSKQKLSARMEANASLVTPGSVLADVGTDHGYIPIALVQRGVVSKAFAMDLREGPLLRAKENIESYGLAGQIETRLSDGVAALTVNEADSIVIAGMGGELVIHILADGEQVCKSAKELILQPQSELVLVRKYLRENGYLIQQENMVYEDGKYYPMMRVVPSSDEITLEKNEEEQEVEDTYGPCLLRQKHPVLEQYLIWQKEQLCDILEGLSRQQQTVKIEARIKDVEKKIRLNELAMQYMTGR